MRNGETELRINRWDEYHRSLVVRGKMKGRRPLDFMVSHGISLRTQRPEHATISAPTFGAMTPRESRHYAAMLRIAAEVAEQMEAVKDWSRPVGRFKSYQRVRIGFLDGKLTLCSLRHANQAGRR